MLGRAQPGMTLIEIMVVIVIIGLIVSGASLGAGSLPRTRLRASAIRVASTFRFAYVHALTTGRTTCVRFPLGGQEIVLEDTDDAHTLDPVSPLRGDGVGDIERAASAQTDRMMDTRPREHRAQFRLVPSRVFRPRALESGVHFTRLYSQHDTEPREEGTGRVYFFAGGQTERAVVHLRNDRGEIYSVMLEPITGRAEVFDRPMEPASTDDRDSTDQVEIDQRDRAPREAQQ